MLVKRQYRIDRGRPATFTEELRGVLEVFAAALLVALAGVALIALV